MSARNVRRVAVVGIASAVVLGAGIASADPGDGGVITACYKKSDGSMRAIDPGAGQTCLRSEKRLTWRRWSAPRPDSVNSDTIVDGSIIDDDLDPSLLDQFALDTEISNAVNALKSALSTSDPGSNQVHWDNVGGVPSGFADGTDEDGAGALRGELSNSGSSDTTVNQTTDPVSWFKIKDLVTGSGATLDGVITGEFVKDAMIDTPDLAPGAVESDKLSMGTAVASDGAVVNDPEFANIGFLPASLTVPPGAAHQVMVTGNAQLSCTCANDASAVVEWQLFDELTDVPVGLSYKGHLTPTSKDLAISVSYLDAAAAPGEHRYSIQWKWFSAAPESPGTTASKPVVTAVDLGQ